MQPQGGMPQKISLPNVKQVVAIASGKGGVGKSTVATNLALAFQMQGHRVGLMDADIYGPSVPRMLGIPGLVDQRTTPLPLERFGMKVVSTGFLIEPTKPVIWRGPMVHQALTQFLTQLDWGQLDYLFVDLPPGTGDAQLSLSQTAPLAGAVIVTMPQDVSLTVARRGIEMFRQVRVPITGVVENMSYLVQEDGSRLALFGKGGGRRLAEESQVPFLGEIPIDPRVAECGDQGDPIVHKYPDSPVAKAYLALASKVAQELARGGLEPELPELKI